ncbi:MAG: hypothetical protein ACI4VH_07515 [Clostridia bacterium]
MEIKDKEIHINRGDRLLMDFSIDNKGTDYIFQEGDRLKFSIYEKKGMNKPPVLQKEIIPIVGLTSVDIDIPGSEMKIGEMTNNPIEYWYVIKLNDDETVMGYDDDDAKILILYPEGADL